MTDDELATYLDLTPAEAAIVIPKLTPGKRAVYDRMVIWLRHPVLRHHRFLLR